MTKHQNFLECKQTFSSMRFVQMCVTRMLLQVVFQLKGFVTERSVLCWCVCSIDFLWISLFFSLIHMKNVYCCLRINHDLVKLSFKISISFLIAFCMTCALCNFNVFNQWRLYYRSSIYILMHVIWIFWVLLVNWKCKV